MPAPVITYSLPFLGGSIFLVNPGSVLSINQQYRKYIKSLIPKGSTCVVTIGSIGKKMTMAHCDCFINQAMNAIIPYDCFDKEYVFYLVKNSLIGLKVLDSGTASGRENVSKSAFSKMELEIETDIETQRRIGKMLSAYDDLIENNRKQIILLEEAAQRLYKEWFVDLRFPRHEHTKIVDGVPEGWKYSSIGEEYNTVLGGTPSREKKEYWGGNIPWINSGEINKDRIISGSEAITKQGLQNSATKLMPIHTTVLAITGATLGQVSYTEIQTCANQSVVGIFDDTGEASEFIHRTISYYIFDIIKTATGGAQQHINKEIVNGYRFLSPDQKCLSQFKAKISPIYQLESRLFFQNRVLTEARDRLLPKLMSGEIEV